MRTKLDISMHILPPHLANLQVFAAYTPVRTTLGVHNLRALVRQLDNAPVFIVWASVPLFFAEWRDSNSESTSRRVHDLALFVLTCAPACAVLGTAFAAVYYALKHRQYGVYLANMRKLG